MSEQCTIRGKRRSNKKRGAKKRCQMQGRARSFSEYVQEKRRGDTAAVHDAAQQSRSRSPSSYCSVSPPPLTPVRYRTAFRGVGRDPCAPAGRRPARQTQVPHPCVCACRYPCEAAPYHCLFVSCCYCVGSFTVSSVSLLFSFIVSSPSRSVGVPDRGEQRGPCKRASTPPRVPTPTAEPQHAPFLWEPRSTEAKKKNDEHKRRGNPQSRQEGTTCTGNKPKTDPPEHSTGKEPHRKQGKRNNSMTHSTHTHVHADTHTHIRSTGVRGANEEKGRPRGRRSRVRGAGTEGK